MLHSDAKKLGVRWDEAEAAAAEAETLGWLTMEGRHSVCLTDSGNRLAPTPSPKPKARNGRQRAGKARASDVASYRRCCCDASDSQGSPGSFQP